MKKEIVGVWAILFLLEITSIKVLAEMWLSDGFSFPEKIYTTIGLIIIDILMIIYNMLLTRKMKKEKDNDGKTESSN